MKNITLVILWAAIYACQPSNNDSISKVSSVPDSIELDTALESNNRTLASIRPPIGYKTVETYSNEYGNYLQNLPLKPKGAKIKYFDGTIKSGFTQYAEVINLPIGDKDLHQCADAIMRMRADYLWYTGQYDKIHFNFTNGMRVDYSNWMEGQRIKVNGNNTSWLLSENLSNTKEVYWKYLEQIWMYAGTLSLSKELSSRKADDIQIGDVFIQGGSPGHAVNVMNIAIHEKTKEKIFLIAQSYMPAQEIHVLTNPNNENLSPWYSIKNLNPLITPEWTFNTEDLKYFKN
jgi:hypothetical protein